MSDLRKPFFDNLIELANRDNCIVFLTGDLGFNHAEEYAKSHRERFLNCGCMEDSMVDIAVGMALVGKKPYVYSVINFLLFRAWEQVRNDISYNCANVKLIGVSGKESYRFLGVSHNLMEDDDYRDVNERDEDVALLMTLPNMQIYTPKTVKELNDCMVASWIAESPTYIRL
uniref:Putative transketolase domain containing protein n=1 Tax=viral metagenome TaxID=1070528 RepID=A0A6M3KUM6_9ZZZZ